MRLGKKPKKSRGWAKAGEKVQPKNVSRESVVGQVTSDLIASVFAPKFEDSTAETLERYADEMMQYEEALQAHPNISEAQVGDDGTVQTSEPPVVEPTRPLFDSQFRIDEFSQTMSEISAHFFAKSGGWRIHANAAKFERMLDEKYGMFRPFISSHPGIEHFVRSVQRKYSMGYFSPFRQSSPPISRSTAIVLLFLMYRGKVQWEIMVLASLFFLVGLQPWALVLIVAMAHSILKRRKTRPVGLMKRRIEPGKPYYHLQATTTTSTQEKERNRKYNLLLCPVGNPLGDNEAIDTSPFNTIVLGSGPSCLYAAALLSRAGRQVLVLCPEQDASGCVTLENPQVAKFKDVPFDIESSNMSKISRQQKLLAPALCTENDCQGGVRFAKIGSEADGYAFEILSVPGVGAEKMVEQIPFVVKTRVDSLMEDAAALLGDGWPASDGSVGHSSTGAYVAACEQLNSTAGEYYLSKILPESLDKYKSASSYQTVSTKYAESILNQYFPLNVHTRSLMAAIGCKAESLRPGNASMAAHITNVCGAMSADGMHYPIGGPRALCHALAAVIEQSGGRIVTNVNLNELLFEEQQDGASEGADSKLRPPTCVGVKLASGTLVRFVSERFVQGPTSPVVVSMLPFISTFIRLFPTTIRTKYGCPRGLGALSEQRPVFKFLFALDGNASDLSITGADYYRVPTAAVAVDDIDPETNQVKHGEIGWADQDEKNTDGAASDIDSQAVDNQKRKTTHKKRFKPGVSWISISFPSAKDPSFASRHSDISTCVVTVEADDDFANDLGSKPRIFQTKKATAGFVEDLKRLQDNVKSDLIDIYPQLEGKIIGTRVLGPYLRGMSHTPERFLAKGVRADTPYRSLYYGGSDLTIGESFSASMVAAWLVSNAVSGYSLVDHLFLQKNITSDLAQFLDSPGVDDDDVAVPYYPLDSSGG